MQGKLFVALTAMSEVKTAAIETEYVHIPKASYEKAMKIMVHQHGVIKQQQLKIKASENLFSLVQAKDEELKRSKETEESLRTALRRQDIRQKTVLAEKLYAYSQNQTIEDIRQIQGTLEADDGSTQRKDCPSMPLTASISHLSADVRESSTDQRNTQYMSLPLKSATSTQFTEVSNVCPSPAEAYASVPDMSQHTSVSSGVLPSATVSSLQCHSANTISKDLVDKIMQQNARLKKAIRDILGHSGLTVKNYLEKREYEDAAEMLRNDVKRLENLIVHLKTIINSRDCGDIDKLSQKCSILSTMVSQLERKLSIQQTYVQQADEKLSERSVLSRADKCTSVNNLQSAEVELHQKIDALTVELEILRSENKKLQSEIEETRVTNAKSLGDIDSVGKLNEELMQQCDSLVADKEALQSQVAAFEEDFNAERQQKLEQKSYYEHLLSQHQEWVRKLANEAQVLQTSLQAERNSRSHLQESRSVGNFNQLPCSLEALRQSPEARHLMTEGVVVDGDEAAVSTWVCPRCDRVFDNNDKYRQHCIRCTDE